MTNKGWKKIEFRNLNEISEFVWHQGFFPYHWNKNIWKRNFIELQIRDLSVFTLGNIGGKKILDIGCGQEALYTLTFLKMGAQVCGQDISERVVESAKETCRRNNYSCEIKLGDCAKIDFPDNSFDAVFSGDVFEHITETQKNDCIKEIFRVLKPGGIVTIKTPNKDYLKL